METLKDKELQQHYDDMFAMFATPGWQRLLEDVRRYMQPREDTRNARTDTIDFLRGELAALDWIRSQKEVHEQAYEALLQEDNQ